MVAKRPAGRRRAVSMAEVELVERPEPAATSPDRRRGRRRSAWVSAAALAGVAAIASGRLGLPGVDVDAARASPTAVEATAHGPTWLARFGNEAPLEPGRYVASVGGGEHHPLLPVLSVPVGFHGIDGIGVAAGDDERAWRVVWVWDIAGVYSHPCDAGKYPAIVGPTVADLANALAAQPLRNGTAPVPVTLGGYRGLFVQLSVPENTDVTACFGGQFDSWTEAGDGWRRWQQGPGQVDMLWILDVAGDRVTIDAAHSPDTSEAAVDELLSIVTTMTFTPAETT